MSPTASPSDASRPPSAAQTPGWRARIALLCAALLFSCLLAELVTAPLYPRLTRGLSRELFLVGFVADPEIVIDDTPTNGHGFTGHTLTRSRPENTVRVLTLGGSAMFNRRMTERLIEGLSPLTSARLEVEGGALRTHTSRSSLIKYERFFSRFDFDYVLIYHGVNDLWANHYPAAAFHDDYSHLNPWYKRNLLLDHSLISRIVYNQTLWRETEPVEDHGSYPSRTTFERNLRTLIDRVHRDGGTPILMTFAWYIPDNYSMRAFQDGTLDYNNPTRYDETFVENWGSVAYVRRGLDEHNAIVRRVAREADVPLIDQEALLHGQALLFGDFCHLSEEGTDVFIGNIAKLFVESAFLPVPPADVRRAAR